MTTKIPKYVEGLVTAESKKDLSWFFEDWVYQDKGLPDFRIESAYSRKTEKGSYLVTVTVVNTGPVGAEVPFTVSFNGGEIVQRIEVRGNSKATTRVEVPGLPQQVVVNDGSVPESDLDQQHVHNHVAVVSDCQLSICNCTLREREISSITEACLPYIQFLGAAGTVTGSKHLINTSFDGDGKKGMQVLVDCGLFQGQKEWRERNWQDTPVPAHEIDAVILTHAHLDHCGWIPRLVKEGFRGKIYATAPTIDLCGIILPDSGHLQEEDADFYNKRKISKHDPALPLYTFAEAEESLKYFPAVQVGETVRLGPELSFRFVGAGHILGIVHGRSHACR